MHFKGSAEYNHHVESYGHPSEFGYHDFVPMFTAEHFDPEEWASLFVKAGARFAGLVAEHHDGFSMWDSEVTPWNAADKGPKRDITGELEKAFNQQGLKLITTFHHARNLQRYKDKPEEKHFGTSHYPLVEGMPPAQVGREVKNVSLVGSNQKLEYQMTDDGLFVTTPEKPTSEMAIVFRIELK